MEGKIDIIADKVATFLSNGMGEIIVIPIVLLVFAMLVKYLVGTKYSDTEWVNFLLEFPIELITIIASVLISVDILSDNRDDKNKIVMAMVYLLVTLIVLIISCFLRKLIVEGMLKKEKIFLLIILGAIIYLIVFGWVYCMLQISF